MTADEFRAARAALGLSAAGMAAALGLGKQGGRTIRHWESGGIAISGPVAIAMRCLLTHGKKPKKKIAKGVDA